MSESIETKGAGESVVKPLPGSSNALFMTSNFVFEGLNEG